MIRHSGSAVNRSNLPEIYRFKIFPGGCLGYLFHSVTSIFDWSDNLVAIFDIKSKSLSVLFLSVRLTLVFEKGEIALKLFATLLAISTILASIKRWIFTWSYRSSIYTKCTGPIYNTLDCRHVRDNTGTRTITTC